MAIAVLLATANLSASEYTVDINGSGGKTKSVFFNAKTGETTEIDNDWELGFSLSVEPTATIFANHSYKVYVVPGSDFDTFGTEIDTTGMAENWDEWINDLNDWNYGALNIGKGGFLEGDIDYGWGRYNMNSHFVTGDKVFILTDGDRNTYQVVIDGLYSNEYIFLWAELDGSNELEGSVKKTDYSDSFMAFFDFDTETATAMPQTGSWDFVVEKYQAVFTNPQTQEQVNYPYAGILTSPNVWVMEMDGVDPYTVEAPAFSTSTWDNSRTALGHDWKKMVGFQFEVSDELVYFLQRVDTENNAIGEPIRFIPQAYSSNVFTFEIDPQASIEEQGLTVATLFPNVVASGESIQLPVSSEFVVYDMNGSKMSLGLGSTINSNNLAVGKYFVVYSQEGQTVVSEFIIK